MNRIIQQTPGWVFVLFFFLLYIGYTQRKTREVSKVKLAILPIAMVGLSIYGILSAFGISALGLAAWAVGVIIAFLLNNALSLPKGASYSPAAGRFTVPGSWTPMALLMAIFFLKYFISASLATKLLSPDIPAFAGLSSLALGLLSGTFFARALQINRSRNVAQL